MIAYMAGTGKPGKPISIGSSIHYNSDCSSFLFVEALGFLNLLHIPHIHKKWLKSIFFYFVNWTLYNITVE